VLQHGHVAEPIPLAVVLDLVGDLLRRADQQAGHRFAILDAQ
jgi:hypothetical protein